MSNTNVGVPRNKPRYAPIRDCYAHVTKPDQAEHSHPRKRGRLANLIREGSEKIVAKAFNKLGGEKDLGSAKDPGQITLKNVDQWLEESGHKRVTGPSIKRKPVPTPAGPPKHQPLISKKPRISKFTEHVGDSR